MISSDPRVRVHHSAEVAETAELGDGTLIWHNVQVRERARLGRQCIVGKGVYIDHDVSIGDNVKIQNGVSVFYGSTVEDGVFLGPHCCLTNDRYPRAINADGTLKSADDWDVAPIRVKMGASIGAGSIILPGVTIGRFALVAAGSVVSRDVRDFELVVGVPARPTGRVCPSAHKLVTGERTCRICDWSLPDDID